MLKIRKYIKLLYILIPILALLVLLPMFSVSWPFTHDEIRYPLLSYAFKENFCNGFYYPRWMPDLAGGYGYPTFVFYQPGMFYIVLFWQFFTDNIILAYRLAFLFLFSLSFLGLFQLTGQFTKNLPVRIFSLLLFAMTPYLYVNLYVRGALSELASLLLIPWPLYFIMLAEKNKGDFKGVIYTFYTSLSLTAMVYIHPFPCIIFFPFFVIFTGAMIFREGVKKDFTAIKMAVAALTASVAMSSPYWLNALRMKKFIHVERALTGYFTPENHFVYPSQLFSNFWGFGGSVPGLGDQMSFQLGLFHFIIAAIGIIWGYKNRLILVSFVYYIFLIILMTPVTSLIWSNVPILPMLQFPWRILSVVSVLQIICCLGVSSIVEKNRVYYIALAVFLLLSGYWYRNQFSAKPSEEIYLKLIDECTINAPKYFISATSNNEFMPLTAKRLSPRGNASIIQQSHLDCTLEPLENSTNHHLKYRLTVKKPVILRINQYYLPGWRVYLNGNMVDETFLKNNISANGLIQLIVQPGQNQTLEAYYDGPPGWRLINIVAYLPLLIFLILFLKNNRNKAKVKSKPVSS